MVATASAFYFDKEKWGHKNKMPEQEIHEIALYVYLIDNRYSNRW